MEMKEVPAPDERRASLHVAGSPSLHELRRCIEDKPISSELRGNVREACREYLSTDEHRSLLPTAIPVLVLRAGLLALDAAVELFASPIGLMEPPRGEPHKSRQFGHIDLPACRGRELLLFDVIGNSGVTITRSLDLLELVDCGRITVSVLFSTPEACAKIREHPLCSSLICGFPDYQLTAQQRLFGLAFDAGDLCTNDTAGARVRW